MVRLHDTAVNEQSRQQVDVIVKQLGVLLARYKPDGAAAGRLLELANIGVVVERVGGIFFFVDCLRYKRRGAA